MSDFTETIPEEYQEPNIALAAKIGGKNRSVLYRDYIKTGDISVSMKSNGKKFVSLSELQRVFGTEVCAKNIKKLCNIKDIDSNTQKKRFETSIETDETFSESTELKIINTRLETENEYLKKMIEVQRQQIQAAELREKRIFEELARSQLLLEGHSRKEREQVSQPSTKNAGRLWKRIKAIFSG